MPDLMWQWLDAFPEQVRQAANLADKWELSGLKPPRSVTFLGIGGSAIGADLVCGAFRSQFTLPVSVVRGESPPSWLESGDLIVAISYSGDTRETLTAFRQALEQGARGACIASGGTLLRLAEEKKFPFLQIPGGLAPRAALGFTSLPLVRVLQASGAWGSDEMENPLSTERVSVLVRMLESLRVEWGDQTGPGVGVGRRILRRLPLIVAGGLVGTVARRFQAQLAENAKAISVLFEIPEALHNLIEVLDVNYIDTFRPIAIYLEDTAADELNQVRMQKIRQNFQHRGVEGIPILSQGETPLERLFSLVHKTDWISHHLAVLKGIDPVAIPIITDLKQSLSKD